MADIKFLERLSALADKGGAEGDGARAVKKLIDGFAAAARESIVGAGDDAAAVKLIRDHAQARLDELDKALADGRDLLKAYADMPQPAGGAKPSLEDWLRRDLPANNADKPKVDRFLSFLDAPGSESIRDEILSTGDVTKLETAIADAKTEIQAGLEQLETVAETVAQEEPPAPQPNLHWKIG